jgi:hypothetical protein
MLYQLSYADKVPFAARLRLLHANGLADPGVACAAGND